MILIFIYISVYLYVNLVYSKKDDSVRQWLTELRSTTESECMSVLQVKPLRPSDPSPGGVEAVKQLKG